VYVPDGVVQMLSEHVRLRVPGDDPDRWMFTDSRGVPLHQNSAGHQWNRTRTTAEDRTRNAAAHMLTEALTADRAQ
jgi:hypothetical protein